GHEGDLEQGCPTQPGHSGQDRREARAPVRAAAAARHSRGSVGAGAATRGGRKESRCANCAAVAKLPAFKGARSGAAPQLPLLNPADFRSALAALRSRASCQCKLTSNKSAENDWNRDPDGPQQRSTTRGDLLASVDPTRLRATASKKQSCAFLDRSFSRGVEDSRGTGACVRQI